MPLRDTLQKLTGHFSHRMDAVCLSGKEVAALCHVPAASVQDALHTLAYPGEMMLPIYLAPLTLPLAAPVEAAVHDLRVAMQKEGFSLSASKVTDLHEQRQGHVWLAKLGRNQYLPIGQVVFVLEERQETGESGPSSTAPARAQTMRLDETSPQVVVRRWWLHHVWLRPAYRCQRIFRYSVPYLETWHPGFVVRDPWPPLARALAGHPGHVIDGTVQWF